MTGVRLDSSYNGPLDDLVPMDGANKYTVIEVTGTTPFDPETDTWVDVDVPDDLLERWRSTRTVAAAAVAEYLAAESEVAALYSEAEARAEAAREAAEIEAEAEGLRAEDEQKGPRLFYLQKPFAASPPPSAVTIHHIDCSKVPVPVQQEFTHYARCRATEVPLLAKMCGTCKPLSRLNELVTDPSFTDRVKAEHERVRQERTDKAEARRNAREVLSLRKVHNALDKMGYPWHDNWRDGLGFVDINRNQESTVYFLSWAPGTVAPTPDEWINTCRVTGFIGTFEPKTNVYGLSKMTIAEVEERDAPATTAEQAATE